MTCRRQQIKLFPGFALEAFLLLYSLLCTITVSAQQWPFAYLRGEDDQWSNTYQYQTEKVKYAPSGHLMRVVNTYEAMYPPGDYRSGQGNYIKVYINQGIQAATVPSMSIKSYRGAEYNWGVDLEMNAASELYILGNSQSSSFNVNTPARADGNYQILLFKTDPKGNFLWFKVYGGTKEDKAVAIKPAGDGNYYILGNTKSVNTGDVTGHHGGTDIWLLKVNAADGTIISKKSFGGSDDDYATDFELLQDGNLLISGYTKSNDGDFKLSGASGFFDGFLLKADISGNVLWQKTIGGNKDDMVKAIHLLPDGGFAATGNFASTDGVIGAQTGLRDMFIQRYDAAANVVWSKTIGYLPTSEELAQDIIFEPCKQQLVIAAAREFPPGFGGDIPAFAKTERLEVVLDLNGNTVHQKVFPFGFRFDDFAAEEVYTTLAVNNFGGFAAGGFKYFIWKGPSPKLATRTFAWREYGKNLRRAKFDAGICAGQSVYGKTFYRDTLYTDTLRDACNIDTLINQYKITISGSSTDIVRSKDTIICSGDVYRGIIYRNNALLSDTNLVISGCGFDRVINNLNIQVKTMALELGKDTSFCSGQSLLLNTPVVPGNYLWNDGSTSNRYIINKPGTYWLRITDPSGCKTSDTIRISEVPDFPISVSQPTAICKGDSILLTAQGANSYSWTPAYGLSCDTCNMTWAKPSNNSQYILRAKNACRTESFSLNIKVSAPEVKITGKSEIFLHQNTTLVASGNGKISWQASPSLSCLQCNEPVATPKETTVYYAVNTLDGCMAKDSFMVKVARDYYLSIPNTFTPNRDGSNDVFRALTNLTINFKLFVYNRWGQLIFSSSDPTKGWDGKFKGIDQPQGGYVYMLQVTTPENKIEKRSGHFILHR